MYLLMQPRWRSSYFASLTLTPRSDRHVLYHPNFDTLTPQPRHILAGICVPCHSILVPRFLKEIML